MGEGSRPRKGERVSGKESVERSKGPDFYLGLAGKEGSFGAVAGCPVGGWWGWGGGGKQV